MNFIRIKACLAGVLLFFCGASQNKKLIGHWVIVKGDPYEINSGDTLTLEKRKLTEKMYEWGSGVQSGFEFANDASFYEYHSVLCSTESSPISHADEIWKTEGDTIFITGPHRQMKFRRILNKRKMLLIKI